MRKLERAAEEAEQAQVAAAQALQKAQQAATAANQKALEESEKLKATTKERETAQQLAAEAKTKAEKEVAKVMVTEAKAAEKVQIGASKNASKEQVAATKAVEKAVKELEKAKITSAKTAEAVSAEVDKRQRASATATAKAQINAAKEAEKAQVKASKEAEKAAKDLAKAQAAAAKEAEKLEKAQKKKSETLSQMLVRYARTTFIITQLYQGYRSLEKSVIDSFLSLVEFEQAMQAVRAITSATEEQFKTLSNQASFLGATTEYTAGQVALLQKELAKLGFTTQEITSSTEAITDLATASGEDLVSSASVAASTLRAFNLDASETERLVNVMAGSFVRSGLNLERFAESMKFVAPVANALNVDVETTTVLLAKLADAGLRGTQAGTSLRNIFSDLASPSSKLAQRLGFTVNNSEELIMAFQKLSEEGVNCADVAGLVDLTARQQFQIFVRQAASMNDLQKEYRNLDHEGRRLARMMRETLANDIKILESSFDGFGRALNSSIDRMGKGEKDLGNFSEAAKSTTEFVTMLTNQLNLGKNLLDAFGGAAIGTAAKLVDFIGGGDLFFNMLQSFDPERFRQTTILFREQRQPIIDLGEELRSLIEIRKQYQEGSEDDIRITLRITEISDALRNRYDHLSRRLAFTKDQLKFYTEEQFASIKAGEEVGTATIDNIKKLEQQYEILKGLIGTLDLYGISMGKVKTSTETTGQTIIFYNEEIAKLKALTEQNIAAMEREAQVMDRSFPEQISRAEKLRDIKVSAIEQELELQKGLLQQQEGQLNQEVYKLKLAELNAKANASIIREDIAFENTLRQIGQRRVELAQREGIATVNTRLKYNQLEKDNQINSYEDRIIAAREYYEDLNALLELEERRAQELLNEKISSGLILQEEVSVERLEMEQDFLRRRLELNQAYFDELFKLERESAIRTNRVNNERISLDIENEEIRLKSMKAQTSARLSQMEVERRNLVMFHGQKKRLLLEEQNMQIQLFNKEADISRQRTDLKLKQELEALELSLETREYKEGEYEAIRVQKLRNHTDEIKAINDQLQSDIQQTIDETNRSIFDSLAESVQFFGETILSFSKEFFTIADNARKKELAAIKRWEDERLAYVQGNAEAEEFVRLQAQQKRNEIELRQAKANKERSLFEIALNTAVAISKASTLLPPANIVQIAFVSALGAAQAAAVLSTPLPEFYKGTSNAPEGFAKVDERGQELIFRKKRNTLELGQRGGTRVTYLEKGDQVFTARQTKELLYDTANISANNDIGSKLSSKSAQQIKVTDEDKIINGVARALSNLPITQTNMDERGFTKYLQNKAKRVETLNKRYKF